MRIAIFDFDGTIYRHDTFKLLMSHLKQHPIYHNRYKDFFIPMLLPYIGYKLKLLKESKMKERSMQYYVNALHHLTVDEVNRFFQEIADEMEKHFIEQIISIHNQHKRDGIYTMIVSGAYTPLLTYAVQKYPFDKIIGTELPYENGQLNSKVPIRHIQGKRKKEEVLKFAKGQAIDWKNSYAYGDSYSDLSVLELVGNPVAVHPDQQLEQIAKERGWKMII